jgi:L-threonylcarbamoyladenylate synthase
MKVNILQAAELLAKGAVIAVPTDTVFGLVASVTFPNALKEIYRLKGRSQTQPLIVFTATEREVRKYVSELPKDYQTLVAQHWPGPLTLVMGIKPGMLPAEAQGQGKTGFRIPKHEALLEVLQRSGPLGSTSANLSGQPPLTSPEAIEAVFGADFPVLEATEMPIGSPSTIVEWVGDHWEVLRQGAVKLDE